MPKRQEKVTAAEQEITDRLVEMVGWLLDYRKHERDARPRKPLKVYSFGDILSDDSPIPHPHEWPDEHEPDHINWGYRMSVRMLGFALHAVGGMAAMDRGIEAVDRKHGGRGVSPVDHAWEGIGSWCP